MRKGVLKGNNDKIEAVKHNYEDVMTKIKEMEIRHEFSKNKWVDTKNDFKEKKGYTIVKDIFVREFDIGSLPTYFSSQIFEDVKEEIYKIIDEYKYVIKKIGIDRVMFENNDNILLSFWGENFDCIIYLFNISESCLLDLKKDIKNYVDPPENE